MSLTGYKPIIPMSGWYMQNMTPVYVDTQADRDLVLIWHIGEANPVVYALDDERPELKGPIHSVMADGERVAVHHG